MQSLGTRFFLAATCCAALAGTLCAQVPDATLPPATEHPVLTVSGRGSQIYSCQQVGSAFQWVFQAPVARLFDDAGNEVGTHANGPTWTYQDSSSIQGVRVTSVPSPDDTSIPWLLLKATAPQRNGLLTTVEFIRRSDTKGGAAPTAGCDAVHTGQLARVPYTATYTFYSAKPQS